MLFIYARRVPRGGWDVRIVFAAFCLWFATGVNDALVVTGVYDFFYAVPIGYAAVVLGISATLLRRFTASLAEVEGAADELQRRVEERTEALRAAVLRLAHGERLATLGQLTSTVSHELRNPLGSIRNAIYALEQSIEAPQRTDQIERSFHFADRNIRRCVLVIDQLLEFAAEKTLFFEPTEIDSFLERWLESYTKPAGVQLATRFRSGVRLAIDRHLFAAALQKLLDNAVESFEEEELEKTEIVLSSELKGETLEIVIRDTGPGIPGPILEKIHEPLFSTKGFGVGLGIPYAHDILQKHSGELAIESEEGAGTTVTIWLPVSGPEDPDPD